MASTNKATGGCLCGAVRYEIHGPMRPVVYCHCEQCRKTSGHFVAASACEPDDLELIEDGSLRWFDSSAHAQRGFCSVCGASLFWRRSGGGHVSIMAGTIDTPTGVEAIAHIFVANASDYYELGDGLPQYADGGPDGLGDVGQ